LYSFAHSFFGFALASGVSGLSYGLGTMVPVSIIINNWFHSHKAIALGICAAGSGIASIILPPIITALLSKMEMSAVFRLEALFVFICVMIIGLLLRNRPEEKGLQKMGIDDENGAAVLCFSEKEVERKPLSKAVWVMLFSMSLLNGAACNPGISHLTVLYSCEGYSPMFVATLFSLVGITLTIGKIIYGSVTDRIGGYKASTLFGIILVLGNLLCTFCGTGSNLVCILACLILGFGYALPTMVPTMCANDLATKEQYSKVIKVLQISYQIGTLAFQSLPGIMADHFGGSYIPSYIMFTFIETFAIILMILGYNKAREKEGIKRKKNK